jgi:hypothetical protein
MGKVEKKLGDSIVGTISIVKGNLALLWGVDRSTPKEAGVLGGNTINNRKQEQLLAA